MLAQVLAAGALDAAEEAEEATDDVSKRLRGGARRTNGALSSLSGAGGLTYMEYGTGDGVRGGGGGRGARGRGGGGTGQRKAAGHSAVWKKAMRK